MAKSIMHLKKRFPKASKIEISYEGSGDNFDSFHSYCALDKKENAIKEYTKSVEDTFDEKYFQDLLWSIIESSDADFNNDGSRGTITFDLVNDKITIDNYYYEMIEHSSGEKEFEDTEEISDEEYAELKGGIKEL